MDMTGERLIAAPREAVWTALNDPEILKACIPGCESIEKLSDTEMKALVAVKLGPIAAKFNGRVNLTDIDAPRSYTLTGEGQGGVAGFGKGSAKVRLEAEADATRLSYVVNSQVGGKMAQLGARLIDSTAKSYAETFFSRFSELVAPAPVAAAVPAGAEPVLVESIAVRAAEPTPASQPVAVQDHAHDHSHAHAEEPEYDHSNPVVAGLPLGIWIPMIIAIVMVIIVMVKFV
jgi:carbon monoxide dehydrogenase subunit G